jgi:hypothetical protein
VSETDLNAEIRLHLSRGAVRVFRNNTGALQTPEGRWVQFGLLKGSGDLIGWTRYTITAEDVGKQVAVFTSIEAKMGKGRRTWEQFHWMATVRRFGGIAGFVKTVDAAAELIKSYAPRHWRGAMEHSNFALVVRNYQPVGLNFDPDGSFMPDKAELCEMRLEGDKLPGGALEGVALKLIAGDESVLILAGRDFWQETAENILALLGGDGKAEQV